MFHNREIKIGEYWGKVNVVFFTIWFIQRNALNSYVCVCLCVLPPYLAGIYNCERKSPETSRLLFFVCLFERIIHFAVAFGTTHFSFSGNNLYIAGEKWNADWVNLKRQTMYTLECWISTALFAQICTDITAKPHSWGCENTASVLHIWRSKNSFICTVYFQLAQHSSRIHVDFVWPISPRKHG